MRTELRRSFAARLFGPDVLQAGMLALGVLGAVAAVLVVVAFGASAALVPAAVEAGAFLLLVIAASTGYARVDENGLSWRLRVPVRVRWDEVRAVEFAAIRYGRFYRSTSGGLGPPALLIRVHGVVRPAWLPGDVHVVAPAATATPERVDTTFVSALVEAARARGVPVLVTGPAWQPVLAAAGVAIAPDEVAEAAPLSRPKQRVVGAVFLVVAVLGLVGAFTGWDARGTGERIAFGVVGLILAILGLLLTLAPGPRGA